ncbi:uncharacterized protein J8A68_004558 [[Candida] subhashii]|uniref:Uncharacterized protein n=1 Tax=[Candida] subhashii TaxID=561895 RepID=A0A8J5UUX2_9ASCO|nr:uncharacterized protein J8A68_004558 [[Candida] subhashii]KAG7661955.1 hypothetical protein J8A68_004558 [[Candida] subhashii]
MSASPTTLENLSAESEYALNPEYRYSVYINPRPDPESNIVFRTLPPDFCRYEFYDLSKDQCIKEFTTKIIIGQHFSYRSEINDPKFFEDFRQLFVLRILPDWLAKVFQLPKLGGSDYTIIRDWLRFFEKLTTDFGFEEFLISPDTFDCRRVDHGVSYTECQTPMRASYMIDIICMAVVQCMKVKELLPEEIYPSDGPVTFLHVWHYIVRNKGWASEQYLAVVRKKTAKQRKRMRIKRRARRKWYFPETSGKRSRN